MGIWGQQFRCFLFSAFPVRAEQVFLMCSASMNFVVTLAFVSAFVVVSSCSGGDVSRELGRVLDADFSFISFTLTFVLRCSLPLGLLAFLAHLSAASGDRGPGVWLN